MFDVTSFRFKYEKSFQAAHRQLLFEFPVFVRVISVKHNEQMYALTDSEILEQ